VICNFGEYGDAQEEADALQLDGLLVREVKAEYVVHDVSIINASTNWYPWVLQVDLSLNGMKKLAERINPRSIAPWNGSGIL